MEPSYHNYLSHLFHDSPGCSEAERVQPLPRTIALVAASWAYRTWLGVVLLGYLWYLKLLHQPLTQSAHPINHALMDETGEYGTFWVNAFSLLKHVAPTARLILRVLLFLFHLLAMFLLVCSFRIIIRKATESSDTDVDRPWNLGQVVALLAWAPVILMYMYMLLSKFLFFFSFQWLLLMTCVFIVGLESGFTIRLSKSFAIIRKPEKVQDNKKNAIMGREEAASTDSARGGREFVLRNLHVDDEAPFRRSETA
jgi:hypothetical protein